MINFDKFEIHMQSLLCVFERNTKILARMDLLARNRMAVWCRQFQF